MKKESQTIDALKNIKQQILDLSAAGISVPDSIKNIDDPQVQLSALEDLKNQSDSVGDSLNSLDDIIDKYIEQEQNREQEIIDIKNDLLTAQVNDTNENNTLANMVFGSIEEFVENYLDQASLQMARNEILDVTSMEGDEKVVGHILRYYNKIMENPEMSTFEKSKIAEPIYNHLPSDMKTNDESFGVIEDAEYKEVSACVKNVESDIKKQAKKDSEKVAKKAFNLTKQAQHGTAQDIIMWGPESKRFDPFLRQPVSDWHIVERNKGYGFVVDDIYNIDWEAIWRGNIMDKYSRPYRNTDTGEWEGGYIEKRFEVDKWIPEGNNIQLLPGQLRKPYNASRGVYEARLEDMREKEANSKGYEPDYGQSRKLTDWGNTTWSDKKTSSKKSFNLKKHSSFYNEGYLKVKSLASEIYDDSMDYMSDADIKNIIFNNLKKTDDLDLMDEVFNEINYIIKQNEREYADRNPGDPAFASSSNDELKTSKKKS